MIRRLVLVLALAMAGRVQAVGDTQSERETSARFEHDDATARMLAHQQMIGQRSPEEQLRVLQVAQEEAARWHIGEAARQTAAAAPDSWVNVGPGDGKQGEGGACQQAERFAGYHGFAPCVEDVTVRLRVAF